MQVTPWRHSLNGASMERWDDAQGPRWRLHWGPSDIFISAQGVQAAVDAGLEKAWACFAELLPGLVGQLTVLRSANVLDWQNYSEQLGAAHRVAAVMVNAVRPYAHQGLFITPMAAVAGSIAQELLHCFDLGAMQKLVVNNGGDIAFYLAPDEQLRCGVHGVGAVRIDAGQEGRGLATSGLGGRSCTLGIADSVTVLAATAAQADAAATMIANAVNVEHSAIERRPASELRDDTDLGELLVTVKVPALPAASVAYALESGLKFAQLCRQRGLIHAATKAR